MTEQNYANSQGIQLLERMVQSFGPIFTLEQTTALPENQALSPRQTRKLISKLAQSGWIEILKRGTYVVRSPLYSGEIPPFGIAAALVQPIAISHWSALAHHGFTTQLPKMIQASTPSKVVTPEMRLKKTYSPRGRAVWQAFQHEFEFIYTTRDKFWGFQQIWINSWQQVDITDPERTALDLIARPEIFGGIRSASEILEGCLARLNVQQLVNYALKYAVGAVMKRLGWLLEKMNVDPERLIPLLEFPVSNITLLDPAQPKGKTIDPRWRINENLRKN